MYAHGSGIRAWRKRWFLAAVAGSRTGHPLQGKVPGGMTLAVFTCRGRPAALNRATLRRYGSLWDGSSLRGIFRRAVLRRPAPALLSVIEGICVTPLAVPLAVPLLLGFGTCQGNSRAASPAHGASQPALRESARLRRERGSGRHLEMGALVRNTTSSTFGLIVQDQIPRACILAVWRIHSPFRQICRGPFCSAWAASTPSIFPFARRFCGFVSNQAVDGETRYASTAAAVWKSAPPIASCS